MRIEDVAQAIPSRLRPSTVRRSPRPGNRDPGRGRDLVARIGAVEPQLGKGGRMPRPRKRQRGLLASTAPPMPSVPMTMIGPAMFGQDLRQHDAEGAIAEKQSAPPRHNPASCLTESARGPRQGYRTGEGPIGQAERDQEVVRPGPGDRHDRQREKMSEGWRSILW